MKRFFAAFLLSLMLCSCSDMKTPDINSKPTKDCWKNCPRPGMYSNDGYGNPNAQAAAIFRTPDIATCDCR
jgi:hypothetical protein